MFTGASLLPIIAESLIDGKTAPSGTIQGARAEAA